MEQEMALVWMVCREQFLVATMTGHIVVFNGIVLHKGEIYHVSSSRIEQEMALVWMVCRGKFYSTLTGYSVVFKGGLCFIKVRYI
jgi:hypothetical protein